ncbi:ecto-NOX disulfide-thiol exchanger 2-like [Achroia grisella]|uniref:ecto-NOX disulfide-thiol exchanger 2-like n=1 Tax=Achroia grisella TaxID=688607 RepID=UPI0027D21BEF|nr:ecto-NOX disulfide-thiol exchanger 2-like [Achroia grisella]XP_059060973.1 ecto-NOX disulfide-thiol exchanger 2-like [Achroia grisella]
MNSWNNEYAMMNQYGIPISNMIPQMASQMCTIPDANNQTNNTSVSTSAAPAPLIGPVLPEGFLTSNNSTDATELSQDVPTDSANNGNDTQKSRRNDRSSRNDRRDRDRDQGRSRRRSRSHDRSDRNSRRRNDRTSRRDRSRQRSSKWDNDASNQGLNQNATMPDYSNMMIQGMIPYNNMMTQSTMDVNMQTMPGMMTGMNMMPNMMEHNMILMQQQMLNCQPIPISSGSLLAPLPNVTIPPRREKPPGCRTIFVGGLQPEVTKDTVTEIFQRFGDISDIKIHRQGVCHLRFAKAESVEQAFYMSGYRFKFNHQVDNEATTIFVDYALNREDQIESERNKYKHTAPVRIEAFNATNLASVVNKIKSDDQFAEAAPTLLSWLERGECNKKNVGSFYSMIQASNNQIRRLLNEKMLLDDEFQNLKTTVKDKFSSVLVQFEQIASIMAAARHQRVSDHFSKQQRRNIEMWLKITEEVENMKDEFNLYFDEEEVEKIGKSVVSLEKYEKLKLEHENLMFELEGYKNEAHLAKDEAERKFEKFKAHFIAQQALQNKQPVYPPLPAQVVPTHILQSSASNSSSSYNQPPLPTPNATYKPLPPPPTPDDMISSTHSGLSMSEVKLISMLTMFLTAHPLGATLDYIVSYLRSMLPYVNHVIVHETLQKYPDVFSCNTSGIGTSIEQKWTFVTFDIIKKEK